MSKNKKLEEKDLIKITFPNDQSKLNSDNKYFNDIKLSNTFVGEIPELPNKPIPKVDINKMKKQFEEMKKKLDQLSLLQKDNEEEEEKKVKKLEPIKFVMESPFILLPILSGVPHPFYFGTPSEFSISVGTIKWLKTLDELRASGWPYYGEYGIELFLLKSAWIVKKELNYNVIKYITNQNSDQWLVYDLDQFLDNFELFKNKILERKFKYINNIEIFCYWYPDPTRQKERLEKGYGKLINDIRLKLGPYAFLPHNYDQLKTDEKIKCPPKDKEFIIDNIKVKGFLDAWTEYDTKNPTFVKIGNNIKSVFECKPPSNLEFSWIPIQYRKEIEEKYNLVQFRYNSNFFQKYIYTLLQHENLEKNLRTVDNDGKAFITVQGPGKMGYKIYLASFHLNFNSYPKRRGIPEGELTLREWMESYVSDISLYPLIHAILNAPAPENGGTPEQPNIYNDAGYIYKTKEGKKMYSDAPVRVFKHQLINIIVGNVNPGEQYVDCLEKFIIKMYDIIYQNWSSKIENFPETIPQKYREILTGLFDYGGTPKECISSITSLSQPTPTSNITPSIKVLSEEELKIKTNEELKKIGMDIVNVIKSTI